MFKFCKSIIPTFASLLFLVCGCSMSESQDANYTQNVSPLKPNRFIELPLGSISADGWLKEMLLRQKEGATGHLDELYPDVMGPRNGWLGGDGDQWERGPYWIDGLLPLAYILNDSTLIAKTTPWIEWTLASSKENGYFGPDKNYSHEPGLQRDNCQDWWPRMVVLKILQQYYSATSDQRVISLMTNYFKYQLEQLNDKPLDNWTFWARFRGGDNLMMVYWLYNITKEDFLLDLGNIIYNQTEPYTDMFLAHDKLRRVGSIHSVNLAMGLKTPIVYYQYDPKQKYLDALDCALNDLTQFHGYPTGMFSGDEAIHGNDPTQGTELCTIVEYLFSLETMYKITANPRYAELIEKIAFNALPTQTDDDYTVRQYYQQVNQIKLTQYPKNFDVNHAGYATTFGLLAGYPCCTSNMHQGWPKFTQNLWYATAGGGLAASIYSPSTVRAKVAKGVDIVIKENTKYPFEEKIDFSIEELSCECEFPFVLRVPEWSTNTTIAVNGKPLEYSIDKDNLVTLHRVWKQGDTISLVLTPQTELSVWKENSRTVERGPLVYSLKVKSSRRKVEIPESSRNQGLYYYEDIPTSSWNYALIECRKENIDKNYVVDDSKCKEAIIYPWNEENAPITITTKGIRMKTWNEYNQMAGPLPFSFMYDTYYEDKTEEIQLIPYGCTTLRITEFPMKGRHSAE